MQKECSKKANVAREVKMCERGINIFPLGRLQSSGS